MDYAIGVYVFDSLLCNIDFLFSYVGVQGNNLPINICYGNSVVVYNSNLTDTASDDSFKCIYSYAADSEDSYMRAFQLTHGFFPH